MLPFQKFKFRFSPFSSAGQGIIEIIVVVGISTIILLALVALSSRANQSSKISSTQDQGARLAQEGLEIIRAVQKNLGSVRLNSANCNPGFLTLNSWDVFFNTYDVDETCSGKITFGVPVYLDLDGTTETIPNSGVSFKRSVSVSDTPTTLGGKSQCNQTLTDYNEIKQFSVTVSWNNSSGDHQSVATACITRTSSG